MPTVTRNLIIINLLFFFGTFVASTYGINLNALLGLHYFMSDGFNPAQIFTYIFMHGGFTHLFFNMFALWMFGRILETVWGPKKFLLYFLVCGVGAGLIQELVQFIEVQSILSDLGGAGLDYVKSSVYNSRAYTVGASGAVYGILLAFGMLFPNEKLFIIPFPFPIKAKYFVIGYALIELYSGIGNAPGDNTAHFAHLGGMIFGLILILYWRKKGNDRFTFRS
ncbi:Peptidase S54, rhomboid domain protein [Bacteroides coprosuis DSM 18011]|uniref:Peptidase S54, rhomboid domain protein n=2 Tax=Bacteroides coprosuis TaxID=151276 RepID=F3ZRG4_9BACE|nr:MULTISPECIES: rhomboid family intramembrane serine protease [Bacteroides]EGJ70689.1 Peptidase S54, rhomboid domain protein [Bacteroides coprosuis DSM 18011]HJD92300.1 rhomboid family intramembrane serine protease [Bacteroides coprosuis]